MWVKLLSLNPYSTGIWSATGGLFDYNDINKIVLILILLEYGLRHFVKLEQNGSVSKVLILILLEYGLRLLGEGDDSITLDRGLNPYSTGIWSATQAKILLLVKIKMS